MTQENTTAIQDVVTVLMAPAGTVPLSEIKRVAGGIGIAPLTYWRAADLLSVLKYYFSSRFGLYALRDGTAQGSDIFLNVEVHVRFLILYYESRANTERRAQERRAEREGYSVYPSITREVTDLVLTEHVKSQIADVSEVLALTPEEYRSAVVSLRRERQGVPTRAYDVDAIRRALRERPTQASSSDVEVVDVTPPRTKPLPVEKTYEQLPRHISDVILEKKGKVDCSVCYDQVSAETYALSRCGHDYCGTCFQKIAVLKPVCAVCRKEL